MSDFGFFAQDVLAKVTQDTKMVGKVMKIPVSVGFKNREEWSNQFFDVTVFEDLQGKCQSIAKGDRIKVSGRVTMREWTDRNSIRQKSWEILASEVEAPEPKREAPPANDPPWQDEESDVPF